MELKLRQKSKTIWKLTNQAAEIIKNKEKFCKNYATVKYPKAERGFSKQLLSNFQAENSYDHRQLDAEVKNGNALKKIVVL